MYTPEEKAFFAWLKMLTAQYYIKRKKKKGIMLAQIGFGLFSKLPMFVDQISYLCKPSSPV